jgi:hypothetical protein
MIVESLHRASIARVGSFGAVRQCPDPLGTLGTGLSEHPLIDLPSWLCGFDSRHPLAAENPDHQRDPGLWGSSKPD